MKLRIILFMFAVLFHVNKGAAENVNLTDGWQVQSSAKTGMTGEVLSTNRVNTDGWLSARVPSTVMGVLIANQREKEPVTADDYQKIDKCQFDVGWWYRTTFELPRLEKGKRVVLSFDGISYRADVWLNGHLVVGKDEMAGPFRLFKLDITSYVRQSNVLAIEVFRAQSGEPNIGFVDWNPRPADESMGIFREVHVKICGSVSVDHSSVRSKVRVDTLNEAWLTIDTELTNHTAKTVKGVLRGCVEGLQFQRDVVLAPHERRMVTLVSDGYMKNPRLWWCHHLGSPELYDLQLTFSENQKVCDSETVRFGIREVKSYLTEEGYRGFTLNGQKMLIRGAGWTDDLFLRDDERSNRQQLEYVRDMNLNTIRLEGFWGNCQSLYDLCDEMGILILVGWSCHWEWEDYLGSPCDEQYGGIIHEESMRLIGKSFEDQVLWLRHHPSVIGWFVGSDRLPKPELEEQYREFLSRYDDRPYLVSAKSLTSTLSGPSGTKMAGPYEYVSPSYWYDPQAPGGAFGFNTETGIGAQLPVKESLKRMLGEQLWPIDDRWNILCTASSSAMNSLSKLTEVIDGRFGKQEAIDDYLRRADLLNYESTRAMFEAFRTNVPRTTGIVQWMLNAARPGIYWQLYDYYLQPNAAYYAVKHGNEPVQLIYNYRCQTVYAVNETLQPARLRVEMQLVEGDKRLLKDTVVTVEPRDVVKTFEVGQQGISPTFLFLKVYDADGREIATNDYFIPQEADRYDWQKTDWMTTPISQYADYRALKHLPHVVCELSSHRIEQGGILCYEVTLKNQSSDVAFFLRLCAKDDNGELVCPSFWSDNYLTLPPGGSRTVLCRLPSLGNQEHVCFTAEGWNTDVMTVRF